MWTKIVFTLLMLQVSAQAEEIDCSIYLSRVESTQHQVDNANRELLAATADLSKCQGISEIMKSNTYQEYVTQLNAKSSSLSNWTEMDVR